ncbi:MAG: formyltetrahydrofolate deformylase [Solirubrobacterales bacterium]|nr:formyltetrahydrofolate deformylase [Solirubrobacterales bacterium]
MATNGKDIARLIAVCRDRHGIIAALAGGLADAGANIVSSNQHSTKAEDGRFFLRMELHLQDLAAHRTELERSLTQVAQRFDIDWQLLDATRPKRVALFVSRYEHCLLDLLWRWRRDQLAMDLTAVVSNHENLRGAVESYGVPFHHVPVDNHNKAKAEAAQLELLQGQVDLVVLARYMQILSPEFLTRVGAPVINIHHSFLPAFAGAQPYQRAFDRGVKLIGATAHYATAELDDGPIIEQDVMRVTHAHDPHKLEAIGADVERMVLARAVEWHLADRVLIDGNRTVIL